MRDVDVPSRPLSYTESLVFLSCIPEAEERRRATIEWILDDLSADMVSAARATVTVLVLHPARARTVEQMAIDVILDLVERCHAGVLPARQVVSVADYLFFHLTEEARSLVR